MLSIEKILGENSPIALLKDKKLFFYFVKGSTTEDQRGDLDECLRRVELYVEKRDGEDMQDDGANNVSLTRTRRTDGIDGGHGVKNERDGAH